MAFNANKVLKWSESSWGRPRSQVSWSACKYFASHLQRVFDVECGAVPPCSQCNCWILRTLLLCIPILNNCLVACCYFADFFLLFCVCSVLFFFFM